MGAVKSKWIGRLEETLGRTIHSVGRVLDDPEIAAQGRGKEREGHVRKVTAKAILRIEGRIKQSLGSLRAAMGRVAGEAEQVRRGESQSRRGRARVEANAPARHGGDST